MGVLIGRKKNLISFSRERINFVICKQHFVYTYVLKTQSEPFVSEISVLYHRKVYRRLISTTTTHTHDVVNLGAKQVNRHCDTKPFDTDRRGVDCGNRIVSPGAVSSLSIGHGVIFSTKKKKNVYIIVRLELPLYRCTHTWKNNTGKTKREFRELPRERISRT